MGKRAFEEVLRNLGSVAMPWMVIASEERISGRGADSIPAVSRAQGLGGVPGGGAMHHCSQLDPPFHRSGLSTERGTAFGGCDLCHRGPGRLPVFREQRLQRHRWLLWALISTGGIAGRR